MKQKVFLSAILLMALALPHSAKAYDFSAVAPSGQRLYYNIVDDHAEVVCPGTGSDNNNYVTGDLIIPSVVTYGGSTYTVTALADVDIWGTFEGCYGLTSVTIPASVTSIGNYVFYGCSGLTSVTIGDGVTSIGDWTFGYCSGLTAVTIPDGVTSIGDFAFYYCYGLTSVTIGDGVTSIGDYAFRNCSGLTSVTIGDGVTSIGNFAFSGCRGLTSVTIPNSVTFIGDYAFVGCLDLTSVTIGNSVTFIGEDAFGYCSELTSVTIGNSVDQMYGAFQGCIHLTSITSRAEYPPICNDKTFESVPNYADITVPCGAAYRYQLADYWKDFLRISENCDAIDDVENGEDINIHVIDGYIVVEGAVGSMVALYDVNGRLLATSQDRYSPLHFDVPASGTYLVRIGDLPARRVVVIR